MKFKYCGSFITYVRGLLIQPVFMSAVVNSIKRHNHKQDPLLSFLTYSKQAFSNNFKDFKKVHVVVGNEACDLDSTVSAIAYAFFNSKVKPSHDLVYIPLLNIPRDDFPLRSDVKHVLSEKGIDDRLLLFRSDIDLHCLHQEKRLSLSLVDFHVLSKTDMSLEADIVDVIDHRKQETKFRKNVTVEIKTVGSCCTLVASRILLKNIDLPLSLVELLYSAIIIDTICMSDAAGKKTEDDEVVVRKLEELAPKLACMREKLFEDIRKARTDVSGLTTLELLRKDLKIISSDELPQFIVAICTIEEKLEVFLKRPDVEESLEKFAQKHSASAVILMFLSINPAKELNRQLGIYCLNIPLRQAISEVLLNAEDPKLILSELPSSSMNMDMFIAYNQGNEKASRKAILPIVKANLNKLSRFYKFVNENSNLQN